MGTIGSLETSGSDYPTDAACLKNRMGINAPPETSKITKQLCFGIYGSYFN
jgi:hypothetical protein